MMNEEKKIKLQELDKNEEFLKKLESAKSSAETIKLFNDYGVQITEDELGIAMESLGQDKELDEKQLDNVAGGWAVEVIIAGCQMIPSILKCNKHTNWGRNGKKCICGYHLFL